jgi:hypothetical protein
VFVAGGGSWLGAFEGQQVVVVSERPAHTDDPTSPACPRFHGEQRPIPNRDGVEAIAESGGVSSMGNNKPTLRRHHVYVNDNARGNATAWVRVKPSLLPMRVLRPCEFISFCSCSRSIYFYFLLTRERLLSRAPCDFVSCCSCALSAYFSSFSCRSSQVAQGAVMTVVLQILTCMMKCPTCTISFMILFGVQIQFSFHRSSESLKHSFVLFLLH